MTGRARRGKGTKLGEGVGLVRIGCQQSLSLLSLSSLSLSGPLHTNVVHENVASRKSHSTDLVCLKDFSHQFYFPRFSDAMKELELLSDRISAMSENDVSFDDSSFNPTAEATTSTPGRKSCRLKLEDSIQQDSRCKCLKTFFDVIYATTVVSFYGGYAVEI
jgi:hypothetical protein